MNTISEFAFNKVPLSESAWCVSELRNNFYELCNKYQEIFKTEAPPELLEELWSRSLKEQKPCL